MNSPLVSICIPTYNRVNYLKKALESCLNQTYTNLEIIITDNSDNNVSEEMIKHYLYDSRIHYYKNDGNIGSNASCVPSGVMYRTLALKSLNEPFDPRANFAGDVDLCVQIALHWDFYYINTPLSAWRNMFTCHTSRLHREGLDPNVFYYLMNKCFSNKEFQLMFYLEWQSLKRDSFYFCTCRAFYLNTLATFKSFNPKIFFNTLRVIYQNEEYILNWVKIPLFGLKHFWISISQKNNF